LENVAARFALTLITGIPLLLSFLVPISRLPLMECPFLAATGLPGPLCGFTRSIWAISAGNWTAATVNCPLAWLVYAAMAGVFAWNAVNILLGKNATRRIPATIGRRWSKRAMQITIALVFLNWIYRLSFGLT